MKNKKGFTLIELLAVIVILAIIIVMAVASVGAVLNRMKKHAYVVEANTIVKALKNKAVIDTSILPTEEDEEDKIIPLSDIELQNGTKSPYGSAYDESSYVKIVKGSTTGVYTYSICIVDTKGNGIEETNIDEVTRTSVKTDVECSTEPEPGLNGNDANTLLLLHGEDLIDSSIGTKTITNDNATVSSTKYKFGTKSLYFNGNSSVYIDPSSSNFSLFNFGSGNFTIDFWINASIISVESTLVNQCSWQGYYGYVLLITSNKLLRVGYSYSGSDLYWITGITTLSTNTWYHVALVRNGTTITIYLNGVADATGTINNSVYFPTTEELRIGRNGDMTHYSNYTFTGYMDEIRISNTARWIANFTPPTEEYS